MLYNAWITFPNGNGTNNDLISLFFFYKPFCSFKCSFNFNFLSEHYLTALIALLMTTNVWRRKALFTFLQLLSPPCSSFSSNYIQTMETNFFVKSFAFVLKTSMNSFCKCGEKRKPPRCRHYIIYSTHIERHWRGMNKWNLANFLLFFYLIMRTELCAFPFLALKNLVIAK